MNNLQHILIVASKNLYSNKIWINIENGKPKVNGWHWKIGISKNDIKHQLTDLNDLGFCNYEETYFGYEINITSSDI